MERRRVPDGSGIARAIDYSLNHWPALTVNLPDGEVPVHKNHVENLMRPEAMGRLGSLQEVNWPGSEPPSS